LWIRVLNITQQPQRFELLLWCKPARANWAREIFCYNRNPAKIFSGSYRFRPEKILRPIIAICFPDFTSEKPGKSGNYARFLGKLNAEGMRLEKTEVFDHYARIPC